MHPVHSHADGAPQQPIALGSTAEELAAKKPRSPGWGRISSTRSSRCASPARSWSNGGTLELGYLCVLKAPHNRIPLRRFAPGPDPGGSL